MQVVLEPGGGICARREHGMHGIDTAQPAGLRAGGAKRDAERNDLPCAHVPGRSRDPLWRDVVQGSQFVILPPLAPVAARERQLLDVALGLRTDMPTMDCHTCCPSFPRCPFAARTMRPLDAAREHPL